MTLPKTLHSCGVAATQGALLRDPFCICTFCDRIVQLSTAQLARRFGAHCSGHGASPLGVKHVAFKMKAWPLAVGLGMFLLSCVTYHAHRVLNESVECEMTYMHPSYTEVVLDAVPEPDRYRLYRFRDAAIPGVSSGPSTQQPRTSVCISV